MSYSAPSSIYSAVKPYDTSAPDAIWEDVVYTESDFNPNAYNPSGAYGLFQLLYPGGQGEAAIAAGHSVNDLYNPSVNAEYGMPAVNNAWTNLGGSFDNSLFWWEKFAAASGHPGGSPGQAYTDQVAETLQKNYQGGGTTVNSNPFSWPNLLNEIINPGYVAGVNQTTGSQATSLVGNQIQQVANDPLGSAISSFILPVGMFVLALVAIIIGFVVLTHE
jgi:hypothetical protein